MTKQFTSLGLMSGTSCDGVDASIIQSDGLAQYSSIKDKYLKYDEDIKKNIHNLKEKINNDQDLKKHGKELKVLEKEITIFHARAVKNTLNGCGVNIDFIGFHGQTIYHNYKKKISIQLGDAHLLAKLTKKKVIFNFRKNDLDNNGQGAPLTPIYHKLLAQQHMIKLPVLILNIGGISNFTLIGKKADKIKFQSADIGPGNCLIDKWVKKYSKKNYDENGAIAKSGKINKTILDKATNNWQNKVKNNYKKNISFDVKDFDISFVEGLSLEDGAATLTEYTSQILSKYINKFNNDVNIVVCGGGRKNNFLLTKVSTKIKRRLQLIDIFKIDGDFVESSAFAYIAIRSYLNLPISFPETTGCTQPCTGGVIVEY
ncbi:MAG: anhydro-N-acetylmuramic acid kinase [Pelagibacterales bacterium]|nr:anhydro-N-acetylmuramic acid kinase [Pelagibacterales bacterium]